MFKSEANCTSEHIQAGPIRINMNEIEKLIRIAHEKSKGQDIESSITKHRNIINMSKNFIKTLIDNPDYDEDQYVLNIDVKEKKPTKKTDNRMFLSRLFYRKPRREYKVIDAEIDSELFSKDLISNAYNETKRLKTIRVICLAILTENHSLRNTLKYYIPIQLLKEYKYNEDIDIKEIIIEWEEELIEDNKVVEKRFKTHLSKNTNADYTKDFAARLCFFNSMYNGQLRTDNVNTVLCTCNASQFKMTNETDCYPCCRHYRKSRIRLGNTTNQYENQIENSCADLNAEISEVKHRVLEVIESIALKAIENPEDYQEKKTSSKKQRSLNLQKHSCPNYSIYLSDENPQSSVETRTCRKENLKKKNSQNRMHKWILKNINEEMCVNEPNQVESGLSMKEKENSVIYCQGYQKVKSSNHNRNNQPYGKYRKIKRGKRKNTSACKYDFDTSAEDIYETFCKEINDMGKIILQPKNKELNNMEKKRKPKSSDSLKSTTKVSPKTDEVEQLSKVLQTKLSPDEIKTLRLLLNDKSSDVLNQCLECSAKPNQTEINGCDNGSSNISISGFSENIEKVISPVEKISKSNLNKIRIQSSKDRNTSKKKDRLKSEIDEIKTKKEVRKKQNLLNKFPNVVYSWVGSKIRDKKIKQAFSKTLPNKFDKICKAESIIELQNEKIPERKNCDELFGDGKDKNEHEQIFSAEYNDSSSKVELTSHTAPMKKVPSTYTHSDVISTLQLVQSKELPQRNRKSSFKSKVSNTSNNLKCLNGFMRNGWFRKKPKPST